METKERDKRTKPVQGRRPPVKKPRPQGARTKQQPHTLRRKERTPQQPGQEIVYTQPGLYNRNRLILHLASVVAVVLALVFGISIFFKAETITVTGIKKYTTEQVQEACGIRPGENLLGLNHAKISSRIKEHLRYVYSVRVGIKLPNTVKIEIVETEVVYAAEAADGSWWLLRSDGIVVEKVNGADAAQRTKLVGILLEGPQIGQKAVAVQPETEEVVLASEQLDVAISLMQYLEEIGILGEMTSIDVTNLAAIEMWYGTRFRVLLGDTTNLRNKVFQVKGAIDKSGDTEPRILDATFTTEPNKVISKPLK